MIRIGILCPSEIALRRFLPALSKISDFKFVGIAYANINEWTGANDEIIQFEKDKANFIIEQFGGTLFDSYSSLIESNEIDSIYIPLPPALHFKWAKRSLLAGKHILIEKPATTSYNNTFELISIAKERNLAIHENYMFVFHNQLMAINEIIKSYEIGDVRLFRLSFGFPRRASNDFRYNKELGGGALLDCGGYTLKYANILLGDTTRIICSKSNFLNDFEVDIYGTATLMNDLGITAQISFGMDNSYRCELEVWGSKGILKTNRIFTAPVGYIPELEIIINNTSEKRKLNEDDAFKKSIEYFYKCIKNNLIRDNNYNDILKQAKLVNDFIMEK